MGERTAAVSNIGARGRRTRLAFGLVALVAGTALLAAGAALGRGLWLAAVFAAFLAGSLGVLQASGHT